jgi:hypothetical protein
MLTLDYALDPIEASKQANVDFATASPEDLHYTLFPGNIYIRGQGVDLSAPWEWIPVLDFALTLETIAKDLDYSPAQLFEFTDSNAALNFRYDGLNVEITANYAPGVLRLPLVEFRDVVHNFCQRVIDELTRKHERLAENPEVRRYLRK